MCLPSFLGGLSSRSGGPRCCCDSCAKRLAVLPPPTPPSLPPPPPPPPPLLLLLLLWWCCCCAAAELLLCCCCCHIRVPHLRVPEKIRCASRCQPILPFFDTTFFILLWSVASARRSGQEDFQRGTPPVSLASCSISPFLRACIITE